jgi:hypothetical protein
MNATIYRISQLAFCACCGFVLYRSGRMALADSVGTQQAMRIEPGDESYIARDAIRRNEEGDVSADVDSELRQALRLNPADSIVLRELGLRAELRGDRSEAERDLLQAVAVDHTFRPSWALANFYGRSGDDAKLRLAVRRCFEIIEPQIAGSRVVSPEPLFDLCWNQHIQAPRRAGLAIPYVEYLMRRERVDAISEALPDALQAAASGGDYQALLELCDFLVRSDRTVPAVTIWNYLVGRGFLHSTLLETRAVRMIADPEFNFPAFDQAFGWKLLREQGAFVSLGTHLLSFELTGKEPEHIELLSKVIPAEPGRTYRVKWKLEVPRVVSGMQMDTGLALHIGMRGGEAIAVCPLQLAGEGCFVKAPEKADQLQMAVRYDRHQGSIRMEGVVRISGFGVELRQ